MKRITGLGLLALGIFLLVLGVGVKVIAQPLLVKDPLTVPAKYSVLTNQGKDMQVFDAKSGQVITTDVWVTRTIHGDVRGGSSSGNSKVAVYDESLCLSRDDGSHPGCIRDAADPRLIQVYTDRIAFDRKTSLAVADPKYNANLEGKPTEHVGLGYKFPIGTKKQTYTAFFDTVVGKAYPMVFQGTDKRGGLTVYKFVQTIENVPTPTSGQPSIYNCIRTVYVEPNTGAIVDGNEQLNIVLTGRATLDPTSPIVIQQLVNVTALKGTIFFTPQNVANQVKFAKENKAKLAQIKVLIPLVTFIGGPVFIIAGVALLLMGRPRRRHAAPSQSTPSQPVQV